MNKKIFILCFSFLSIFETQFCFANIENEIPKINSKIKFDNRESHTRLDATPGFRGTMDSVPADNSSNKTMISTGNAADVDTNVPVGNISAKNTFAVIIANGEYMHASSVSHAVNDGEVMATYLTRTLGIPEENVALFLNATSDQIASALSMLRDIGDAYDGDDLNLILYYVGHGLPDDKDKKSYILPVDIDPRHANFGVSLDKIYHDLGSLGAKKVTILVDACFSGSNHGDGMLTSRLMSAALILPPLPPTPVGNMVVMTAATGNETAYTYEEKSHGLFTYWILKKLQETGGNVSWGDMSDYVIENVERTSIINYRKRQTPTVSVSPGLSKTWRSLPFGL